MVVNAMLNLQLKNTFSRKSLRSGNTSICSHLIQEKAQWVETSTAAELQEVSVLRPCGVEIRLTPTHVIDSPLGDEIGSFVLMCSP
jgi:hypothetical protein